MPFAVIDLGTNTWNLLIAEPGPDKSFKVLWDEKVPVKLGKGGISKKIILPDAMQRGLDALKHHQETIRRFHAEPVEVIATSAFRTASNGEEFCALIYQQTGLEVNIVSGSREAELIFNGIRASVPLGDDSVLVLDIGGGSNEFIIGNGYDIFWKKSYKLGIARLLEVIKPSDPILPEEISRSFSYFSEKMKDLSGTIQYYTIHTLVGAAGSFETFAAMLHYADPHKFKMPEQNGYMEISPADFDLLYEQLIHSTHEERLNMKGLEPMRAEMIVLAAVFVKFVLSNYGIRRILQSNYSLKEGVASELVDRI